MNNEKTHYVLYKDEEETDQKGFSLKKKILLTEKQYLSLDEDLSKRPTGFVFISGISKNIKKSSILDYGKTRIKTKTMEEENKENEEKRKEKIKEYRKKWILQNPEKFEEFLILAENEIIEKNYPIREGIGREALRNCIARLKIPIPYLF